MPITFEHPERLWWGALAAFLLLASALWRKRKPLPTAAWRLWREALPSSRFLDQGSPWSLILPLAFVAAAVSAMAEPVWMAVHPPARVVLVIDASASMKTRQGASVRFEQAIAAAQRTIAGLRPEEETLVLSAGSVVRAICPFTTDRSRLRQALSSHAPTDASNRVMDAVDVARRLTGGHSSSRIVVITDGCFDGADTLAEPPEVTVVRVGSPVANAAVAQFANQPHPSDAGRQEVFVEVKNFGAVSKPNELIISQGSQTHARIPIATASETPATSTISLPLTDAAPLSAFLLNEDSFAADNRAWRIVQPASKVRVDLGGSSRQRLSSLLSRMPDVRLDGQAPDVSIWHEQAPSTIPPGPALVLAPQADSDLWTYRGTMNGEFVATTSPGERLFDGVALEDAVIEGVVQLQLHSPAQTLAVSHDGLPVVSRVGRPSGDVTILHIDLDKSDFALRRDFGNFLSNFVRLYHRESGQEPHAVHAGEMATVATETSTVVAPSGRKVRVPASRHIGPLDEVGVWRTPTESIACNVNPIESELRFDRGLGRNEPSEATLKREAWLKRETPLAKWLIVASMALLWFASPNPRRFRRRAQ